MRPKIVIAGIVCALMLVAGQASAEDVCVGDVCVEDTDSGNQTGILKSDAGDNQLITGRGGLSYGSFAGGLSDTSSRRMAQNMRNTLGGSGFGGSSARMSRYMLNSLATAAPATTTRQMARYANPAVQRGRISEAVRQAARITSSSPVQSADEAVQDDSGNGVHVPGAVTAVFGGNVFDALRTLRDL